MKKKWSIVSTKGTRPGARDGHSACVINKKMYIFGGYEEELDRFSDDIHSFCFETNMWEFVRTKVIESKCYITKTRPYNIYIFFISCKN